MRGGGHHKQPTQRGQEIYAGKKKRDPRILQRIKEGRSKKPFYAQKWANPVPLFVRAIKPC